MTSVFKRGKTWAVRFSKRYKAWDPKQNKEISKLKQKYKGGFHTKLEAEQYGVKMEAASLSGIDVTKNPIFYDYVKNWYETFSKPHLAPASKDKRNSELKKVKNYFGLTRIDDINRTKYQEFINHYAAKFAPATVRQLNGFVRSAVRSAIADGLIARDFSQGIDVHGREDHKLKVQYLTIDEIKRLVKVINNSLNPNIPSAYMILLAIYSGARLGEISALKWPDIDFDKSTIHITKSYDAKKKRMGPTKTGKSRTVVVNSFVLNRIKELKQNKTDFVFGSHRNKIPSNSADLNHMVRSFLKKAHIKKDLHFHSLRHVHVAFLLSQGVSIVTISKRLGHANIDTTLRYYAYLIDELSKKENSKIVSGLDSLSA